ncbi:MAG: glutathione S-transferase [Hyphomicrobiales bacterium]|nr:glutathione S-transferase [Hyphomicrobiales bacterium]
MKLYYNKPSPYARKVLVAAHETGLADRLTLCEVDPWSDPAELHALAPVGRVPALIMDNGAVLSESTAICEHLDAIGNDRALVDGERLSTMARIGLAQGLIDAAFGIVIEARRPAEAQWTHWTERQRRAIERILPRAETADDGFDLGDIALACGLAYLDFRLPEIAWRFAHPTLAQWLDGINERPSMQATQP